MISAEASRGVEYATRVSFVSCVRACASSFVSTAAVTAATARATTASRKTGLLMSLLRYEVLITGISDFYPKASSPVKASPVGLDQDLRDLRRRELDRGQLAPTQHLSHLRPGEEDVVVAAMRTGLRRHPRAADAAEDGVLEEHRLHVELVRRQTPPRTRGA